MKKFLEPIKSPWSKPRKPLRSFKEMAEEFGITEEILRGRLQHSENAPKPVFVHKNARSCSNRWYDPAEMRRWWKSIQEPKGDV
jgi:hypothetical protein